jgi:NAD(P)-dependent dehydrogenase (short-subunit alcohol dehydrogenase family)
VRRIDSLQQLHDLAAAVPFVQSSPMGSQPADKPGAMAPTYSVAKALMNRMTQLMAAEGSHLAQRGVSVVAASPGWCRTDMGTDKAERSAAEGADSVLWPWLNWQPQLNGGFTRDGVTLEW